ncbi:hypothetical protein B0H19DRAFT_1138646 [Mycena capillaripes]|nr:hypothetical protein B0H19DRAFT_1138646 [Mycena capillaripes]
MPSKANPLEGLDTSDIIRLSDAQKRLNVVWLTMLSPSALFSEDTCPAETPCGASKRGVAWLRMVEALRRYHFDPLCGLGALMTTNWTLYGFCLVCAQKQTKSLASKRQQIWEDLDDWLKIPVGEEKDDEET